MIDPKTLYGTAGGATVVVSKDISGSFSEIGLITTTGTMYIERLWKEEAARGITSTRFGQYVYENRDKLGWVEVLAFVLISATKQKNKYNGATVFLAGRRQYDDVGWLLKAKELVASNRAKTWNSIMLDINRMDPILPDDTIQPDSPFNPASQYYNPDKAVFSYDPDYGYIIYRSGEIVWTKDGGRYYDSANGQAVSYDPEAQTVRFSSGAVLNLVTMVLTRPDGTNAKVSNAEQWYQKWARLLLSDTKTQLMVLGSVVILVLLKNRIRR